MKLEICVNSARSAIEAQRGGADRVELCENMMEGGCTPSAGSIRTARQHLAIDLFVMIRPRGADFLYNEAEFEIMKHDIVAAKELGADGVVLGILTPDGRIDMKRMGELVELAHPLGVTCHRAFDMTRDPFEALEDLISLKVSRVLTSGQSPNALSGAPLINQLIEKASGRIIIIPGGGIKEDSFLQVINETSAEEFHMRLDKTLKSGMKFIRGDVKMGNPEKSEFDLTITDWERVRIAKTILSV